MGAIGKKLASRFRKAKGQMTDLRRQVAVVGPERVFIDYRERVVTRQPQGDPHTVVLVLRVNGRVRRLTGCSMTAGSPVSGSMSSSPSHMLSSSRPSRSQRLRKTGCMWSSVCRSHRWRFVEVWNVSP